MIYMCAECGTEINKPEVMTEPKGFILATC